MSDRLAKLRREVERERRKAERQQRRAERRPVRARRIRMGAVVVAGALAAVAGGAVWLTTGGAIPGLSRASESASEPGSEPAGPAEGSLASPQITVTPPTSDGEFPPPPARAAQELGRLVVARNQGSASYQRSAFGPGWGGYGYYPKVPGGCEARDEVLRRDLSDVKAGDKNHCIIFSGVLHDPYTGKELPYSRYGATQIQIDHVVALGAAWRSGASTWTGERRLAFANDINNMLAVDKTANTDKGSMTPDQWRPPKDYWCPYAERWVGIKTLYGLTVTAAEKTALEQMLAACQ
ncbi:MAG TPA: HNH endonuclease family protein [Streptosporangiaceae bacterium]